jgi:hypothetical protein
MSIAFIVRIIPLDLDDMSFFFDLPIPSLSSIILLDLDDISFFFDLPVPSLSSIILLDLDNLSFLTCFESCPMDDFHFFCNLVWTFTLNLL